jgi:hypothetical protein
VLITQFSLRFNDLNILFHLESYRLTVSNRNFLTEEQFAEVKARDPNYAGYVDLDFLFNPTTVVFKSNILNEMFEIFRVIYAGKFYVAKVTISYGYVKVTYASLRAYTQWYVSTPIKKQRYLIVSD